MWQPWKKHEDEQDASVSLTAHSPECCLYTELPSSVKALTGPASSAPCSDPGADLA